MPGSFSVSYDAHAHAFVMSWIDRDGVLHRFVYATPPGLKTAFVSYSTTDPRQEMRR